MSDGTKTKIVITKEELRDPKIDEAIDRQRSYDPGAIQPTEKKSAFRLIYATWFYLALAGAVGAFAAWALIEPSFEDAIFVTGRVEEVRPDAVPLTFRGTVHEIRGAIRVAGITTYTIPERTKIIAPQEPSGRRHLSLGELKPGQVVKVMGVAAPDSSSLIALVIRQEDGAAPSTTNASVWALNARQIFFGFLLLPCVAALVGLMVGAVEGIICRTFARAAWCGAIGLIAGLLGGALSALGAGLVFGLIGVLGGDTIDPTSSGPAFLLLMFRRSLAWTIAGMAMGLGQGFALKSSKLKFNGFVGGMVGGLLGGLLFDPLDLLLSNHELMQGAELSRAVGLTIIGATVGLMIGLTDLLTRDAWLKVTKGPLRGKEFSFNRTPIRMGSSPKNEIYLFKDIKIEPVHAEINKLRDTFDLADLDSSAGTFVNGLRIRRHRLADGDLIRIGDYELVYSTREKARR